MTITWQGDHFDVRGACTGNFTAVADVKFVDACSRRGPMTFRWAGETWPADVGGGEPGDDESEGKHDEF